MCTCMFLLSFELYYIYSMHYFSQIFNLTGKLAQTKSVNFNQTLFSMFRHYNFAQILKIFNFKILVNFVSRWSASYNLMFG